MPVNKKNETKRLCDLPKVVSEEPAFESSPPPPPRPFLTPTTSATVFLTILGKEN